MEEEKCEEKIWKGEFTEKAVTESPNQSGIIGGKKGEIELGWIKAADWRRSG